MHYIRPPVPFERQTQQTTNFVSHVLYCLISSHNEPNSKQSSELGARIKTRICREGLTRRSRGTISYDTHLDRQNTNELYALPHSRDQVLAERGCNRRGREQKGKPETDGLAPRSRFGVIGIIKITQEENRQDIVTRRHVCTEGE